MIGALYNGISGLDAYQKALNVESNNIANVNTAGYKADVITFADAIYQAGVGKGVSVSDISKSFIQGNIKVTGNPYDMAIQGSGFFVVSDGKESFYTRNGTFKMGTDGTLQTLDEFKVNGFASAEPVATSSAVAVQFDDTYSKFLGSQYIETDGASISINAKSTDYTQTAQSDNLALSGNGYKTAKSKISDIEALTTDYQYRLKLYANNPIEGTPSIAGANTFTINPLGLDEESDLMQITINGVNLSQNFDTDATTTLKNFADKISSVKGISASVDEGTGLFTITSLVPGKSDTLTGATLNGTSVNINNIQTAVSGTGLAGLLSTQNVLQTSIKGSGADFLQLTNTIDLTNQDALELGSINLKLTKLSSSNNGFGDLSVENGVIFINQDGSKFAVGKIPTVIFNDANALGLAGDSKFKANLNSGEAVYAGDYSSVNSKMLELSNSDLSVSLTSLMIYQRAFEANSKAIVTSDEFLNTAIQLKS